MTTHSILYDAVKRGVSAKLSPAELGSEATGRHTWCCVWDGPTGGERSEPGQTCARVRSARLVPALLAAEPVPRWFGRGACVQVFHYSSFHQSRLFSFIRFNHSSESLTTPSLSHLVSRCCLQ